MKSVFEVAYRYAVPSIRRSLAAELERRGLLGMEVARSLGLSSSLITRYRKGERGASLSLDDYREVKGMIERLADKIASGELDEYAVQEEMTRIVLYIMARKLLCRIHTKVDRGFDSSKCNICPKLFSPILREFH